MRALVFSLPLVLAASCAAATDVKLEDGRILKNAEVSKFDPSSVTFSHDDGIVRVPFEKLPLEFREKYGIDGQKAAEFRKKETDAKFAQEREKGMDAKSKALDSKAIEAKGKILQAVEGGALIELEQFTKTWVEERNVRQIETIKPIMGSGLPAKVAVEIHGEWKEVIQSKLGLCFVEFRGPAWAGVTKDAGEAVWRGHIWRIGNFQYEAVNGATQRIPKYTVNRASAEKWFDSGGEKAEALEWIQKATAEKNAEAQYKLGDKYANGNGVPKNETKAAECYQKAALQGNSFFAKEAQISLGNMYAEGKGVPKDAVRAYAWLNLAAAPVANDPLAKITNNYNSKRAAELRDEIALLMTVEEIAQAQKFSVKLDAEISKN